MNKYKFESLNRRIRFLEYLVYEGKQDEEKLRAYFGDKLTDEYLKIRNRIPSEQDLLKAYPPAEEILDNQKVFIKKYNKLRQHNLITGMGSSEFMEPEYPDHLDPDEDPGYYDVQYDNLRDYIISTLRDFREFERLRNLSKPQLQSFVNSYISQNQIKRQIQDQESIDVEEGSSIVYRDSTWTIYKVYTYKAAKSRKLSDGVKWCITGRYEGHEERGEEYFNDYINENNLDGGYYFYIKNDGTKFCLLRRKDGSVHSIWNAADDRIEPDYILLSEPDFPDVPDIFTPPHVDPNGDLFSNEIEVVSLAINNGKDVNEICKDRSRQCYNFTPLEWAIKNKNYPIASRLAMKGAKVISNKIGWKDICLYSGSPGLLDLLIKAGLSKFVDINEILQFTHEASSTDFTVVALKKGADANTIYHGSSDVNGLTPLQYELKHGNNVRVTRLKSLIKYGAIVNSDSIDFARDYNCSQKVIDILQQAAEKQGNLLSENLKRIRRLEKLLLGRKISNIKITE